MSNEEKILYMLTEIRSDIRTLKYDVRTLKERKIIAEREKLSPEERRARQMAALEAFYNSTTDDEEPEATAKFFAIMAEIEARRSE